MRGKIYLLILFREILSECYCPDQPTHILGPDFGRAKVSADDINVQV